MLISLFLPALIGCLPPPAPPEPDGSRTLGIVPPYHAEPAPPEWLRKASNFLIESRSPNPRHYLYEAYGDGCGDWLVRYLRFPGSGEAVDEVQQVFFYTSDPLAEPRVLSTVEITFGARRARWEGLSFVLVDKRDLLRPGGGTASW